MTETKSVPNDGKKYNCCSKCGGTGFYCMGVLDGNPYSHTGFKCYGCNGLGWKPVKSKRKFVTCKCCGSNVQDINLERHSIVTSRFNDEGKIEQYICNGTKKELS